MKIKISKSQWEGIGRKAGWIKKAQELPNPYIAKGYIYQHKKEFIAELEAWVNQIKEGWNELDPGLGETLYYELIDWFDDNISKEKDEDYIYPIVATVDKNGRYTVN